MTGQDHPLGFRKLTLFHRWGFQVRVHVWRRGTEVREDRHTDRSTLLIVPLWGRFVDCRWRRVEGDDLAVFVARAGCETLYPLGRGALTKLCERVRWPGVPYLCRWPAIHSVAPVNTPAISLVLVGRPVYESSTIWRTPTAPEVKL